MSDGKGPLGVFDSGVGGLTVVGALLRRFPQERVLYVADQAHVPFGGRPFDEVRTFAAGISRFLAEQGCRSIVMACNISSATALESVAAELAPTPVFGVIAPAAMKAALSGTRTIGVLATEGTVKSGAYEREIRRLNPDAKVVQSSCPKFVPLVESGRTDCAEAMDAAREYLRPLAENGCCTVILGCTHYPFLLPVIKRAASEMFDNSVVYIDPADEVTNALEATMPELGTCNPNCDNLLLTTGCPSEFAPQALRFLPDVVYTVDRITWNETDGSLHWCDASLSNRHV